MAAGEVLVFVKPGDPDSASLLGWLRQRGVAHRAVDVTVDPSASAILFGRLGRIAVPAILAGDRLVVGYDPVQLLRLFPAEDERPRVAFGAAVRSVSEEVARERGLPGRYGVEVGRVTPGSPAEAAGIVPGDLIVSIGPYTLQGGADQFRTAVAARQPGDVMRLGLWREGATTAVEARFPLPAAAEPSAPPAPPG